MAMMAGTLYAALKAANVPESHASAAAEEATGYENRFQRVETELGIPKWMMGTMIALQLGTIGTIVGFAINNATFH